MTRPTPSACTGITLTTTGGEHISARTIEWGRFNLNSRLIVSPRGHRHSSALPYRATGASWVSRYGFVGISVSDDTYIGEGLNEAGLNAGLFYFKDYGRLAPFDGGDDPARITDMDFVRWLLSRFATVEEVRQAVGSITLTPVGIDGHGVPTPTAHWRVTDKSGGSIVIEVVDGGVVHIYDNHVGVITNPPGFPWQVANLNNYVNLAPGTAEPRTLGDITLTSFGGCTGALGLPGDFSPPSRFVRAAFFRATAPPLATPLEAVSQAFHILNTFDIPLGVEFGLDEREQIPADLPSATQWTSVSDLGGGAFFYKTMHDSTIKRISLDRIDLATGRESSHPLDRGAFTFAEATPDRPQK